MTTSEFQQRNPAPGSEGHCSALSDMSREVLRPPRVVWLWRATFLFALSLVAMQFPDSDAFTRLLAVLGFGYSLYFLATWSRARVVLSQEGLKYRGTRAEKTLSWDRVRAVRTIRAPIAGNPDLGSLTRRFQVSVELTTGQSIELPGFDSGRVEPMQHVVDRINEWRAAVLA